MPLTADVDVFAAAADLGRTIIWLHTFGERFAAPKHGRPASPPRMPKDAAPRIPAAGAISQGPAEMTDSIDYDEAKRRLLIGGGCVEGVPPEVWNYEVSGKQVLRQWFSYRKANRERPIIGDRRRNSATSSPITGSRSTRRNSSTCSTYSAGLWNSSRHKLNCSNGSVPVS